MYGLSMVERRVDGVEYVRQLITAEQLMKVMTLPESMHNQTLEVIVRPTARKGALRENADEIEAAIRAISGMIPDGGRSLEEYREERLKKYESLD